MARSWLVCVSLPFPKTNEKEEKGVNVLNTFPSSSADTQTGFVFSSCLAFLLSFKKLQQQSGIQRRLHCFSCESIPFDGISCASWRRGPWIRRGQNERRNGSAACSRKEPQKCWGTSGAGESDLDRSTVIYCTQWKSNKKNVPLSGFCCVVPVRLHGFPRKIKRPQYTGNEKNQLLSKCKTDLVTADKLLFLYCFLCDTFMGGWRVTWLTRKLMRMSSQLRDWSTVLCNNGLSQSV